MATFQLKSTSETLSFDLKKNPNSGMIVKSLRSGMMFGWFDDSQTYNLYFKENEGLCSFSKEPNYLDVLQYSSTYPAFQGIALYFNHLLKKDAECGVGTHTVHLPCIQTKPLKLKYIASFLGLDIELIEHNAFVFEFNCIETGKLNEFLMKIFVLFYLDQASGYNGVIFFDELTKKVARILRDINAPYFMRYYLSRTAIKSENLFNEVKSDLESSDTEALQLFFGNTQTQREQHIESFFTFDKSIIDIGCGEGNYTLPYAKKLRNVSKQVHAIDIDSACIQVVADKADIRKLENVTLYNSLQDLLETQTLNECVDVLMTEVVEHMPLSDATQLVNKVLNHIDFDTFVITTPDADFNQFYKLDTFRHPDHHWEMTKPQFMEWINTIASPFTNVKIEYVNIGDVVNGIATSQGVVIKKIK